MLSENNNLKAGCIFNIFTILPDSDWTEKRAVSGPMTAHPSQFNLKMKFLQKQKRGRELPSFKCLCSVDGCNPQHLRNYVISKLCFGTERHDIFIKQMKVDYFLKILVKVSTKISKQIWHITQALIMMERLENF